MSTSLPTGWYSDADGKRRYWNGSEWSDFKFEGTDETTGAASVADPLPSDESAGSTVPLSEEPTSAKPPVRRRGRTVGIVVAAVVASLLFHGGIGAAAVGVTMASGSTLLVAAESAVEEKIADERAASALAAEELAAETARVNEQAWRESLVVSLEIAVREHARELVDDGWLEGPILEATCMPADGASRDDLSEHSGNFSCIAVTEKDGDQVSGYGYTGSIGWADGTYSWSMDE